MQIRLYRGCQRGKDLPIKHIDRRAKDECCQYDPAFHTQPTVQGEPGQSRCLQSLGWSIQML